MTRILLSLLLAAACVSAACAEEKPLSPTPEQLAQDLAEGRNDIRLIGEKGDHTAYVNVVYDVISKILAAPALQTKSHKTPASLVPALELAGALGSEGADRLAPLLGRLLLEPVRGAENAQPIVQALAKMGDPGLAQAAEILKNHTPALNGTAAYIGIEFKARTRALVPLYATILEKSSGDKETIQCIIQALSSIGVGLEPAKAVLLKLAEAQKDPNDAMALLNLIAIGADDLAPCKKAFIAALKDERVQDADFACLALVRLNDDSPEAIDAIKQRAMMHGRSPLPSCVEMLAGMRSKKASEFFRAVAGGEYAAQDRASALLALLDAGESFEAVRPLVLNFLKSSDWTLRAGAARAIVRAKAHDPELAIMVAGCFQASQTGESTRKNAADELAAKMNEFDTKRENMTENEQIEYLQELKKLKAATLKAPAPNNTNAVDTAPAGFVVWGNAVLAAHASDPSENLAAIWTEFKKSKSHELLSEPLEALSLLKPGNAALIGEIKLAGKDMWAPDRVAELSGLLACWNVDTAVNLSDLKGVIYTAQTPNAGIVWIERIGKEKAIGLAGDLKRWSTDSPKWDNRIYAQLILRRWGMDK